MSYTCKNCNKLVDDDSPICMFCGFPIPDEHLSAKTKNNMYKSNQNISDTSNIKAIGATLIIISIIINFIPVIVGNSIFITIIGIVLLLIGLALITEF